MKLAVPAIPAIALLTVVAIGCSTSKKGAAPTATSGALDVTPPAQSAAMTSTPTYTPPPPQQVPAFTEPPAATNTPPAEPPQKQADAKGAARKSKGATSGATANATKPGAKTATAGKSYTVRDHDTLFKIARDQYGDGNQWKKIAAANPGLNADTLRVGQTITIPQ